jgi:hypothetical protein
MPNILNTPPWKKFIALLSDTFKAKGSSVFSEQHILQEASRVCVEQREILLYLPGASPMVEYVYKGMLQRRSWSGVEVVLCMCGGGSMRCPGVEDAK